MFEPNMFDPKTPLPRTGRPLLNPARAELSTDPKQRRMMVIALALLLVTLGFVLFHDRDFWFPDTEEAQETPDASQVAQVAPSAVALPAQPVAVAKAVPAPGKTIKKSHVSSLNKGNSRASSARTRSARISTARASRSKTSTAQASGLPRRDAAATPVVDRGAVDRSAIASSDPSDAPAGMTVTNRTVLPPLEVEVVAGDTHRSVHPGTNAVNVDVQPNSASDAAATPSSGNETAASATNNAAERVEMSADTTEVVSQPVQPGYPTLARQMKVQGSVVLRAFIGRDGLIQDLHVVSGPPILASAAEEAVKQWHFKPHFIGAAAVETQAKITVNFTISTN
jgi:TonB family protein